jgi:uncharacterized protein
MKLPLKLAKHKKALITGASSGIGLSLAKLLAQEGIELILFGRDQKALSALSKELHVSVTFYTRDFADVEGRSFLCEIIKNEVPDLVINNAGLGFLGEAEIEESNRVIDVNCKALTQATITAVQAFRENNRCGTVCNIASALADFPAPYSSVYAASKAFVKSFSIAQDYEAKPYGIRVLVACPGQVVTQFRKRALRGEETKGGNSFFASTSEKIARDIWRQIQRGKQSEVMDYKTRLLCYVAKFIPRNFIAHILYKEMKARLKKRDA